MIIPWYDKAVRLTGRWSHIHLSGASPEKPPVFTATTAPGAYFELAFTGRMAVLRFDMTYPVEPYPHLWISVDGGAAVEVQVDRFIRVQANDDGQHLAHVLYKGGMEQLPRWHYPQMGSVAFIGAQVESAGELPHDDRPLIEFIGDSITEGVLIDMDFTEKALNPWDQYQRPYEDDHCATWAHLTAKALNLRAMVQAYGGVGMINSGCGSVPRAGEIYPYAFAKTPYRGPHPAVVLINHGANDLRYPAQEYLQRYSEFLDMVRATHPEAKVVVLSPFCGAFNDELTSFIPAYNAEHQSNVHFISSKGWIPVEPLHPLRDGHMTIAQHLIPLLQQIIES